MKNKMGFVLMLLFAVVFALTSCGEEGSPGIISPGGGYAIGDTGPSGVGLVFYISDGGLHGYEVAPVDQGTAAEWSTIEDTFAGGTAATPAALPTGIGDGSDNTAAIIAQNSGAASAALLCRNYRLSEEGDWFLPSKDELAAIWDNLVYDGTPNGNSGVGSFGGYYYWSSSESATEYAYHQFFYNHGNQAFGKKDSFEHVRAVRAF